MAQSIFTPSLDGFVARTGVNENMATIRAGAGTTHDNTSSSGFVIRLTDTAVTNQYSDLYRAIYLFDTSTLPVGAVITSATFQVFPTAANTDFLSGQIFLVSSNPASTSTLANSDYGNLGSTILSTGSVGMDPVGWTGVYQVWTLNATGIAAINTTGITKLGLRMQYDINNTGSGVWNGSGVGSSVSGDYSENSTNKPQLIINYTLPAGGGVL